MMRRDLVRLTHGLKVLPLASPHVFQVVSSASTPPSSGEGLHFSDGCRKVDYVLVFHQRRRSSIRSPARKSVSQDRLSIVSNGNFPPAVDADAATGGGGLGREAASGGEVFMELEGGEGNEPVEAVDHEMQLIRQEFEANLLEAGLEIERDREVSDFIMSASSTQPADDGRTEKCDKYAVVGHISPPVNTRRQTTAHERPTGPQLPSRS